MPYLLSISILLAALGYAMLCLILGGDLRGAIVKFFLAKPLAK
jgi:hypothetical protein